MVKIVDSEIEIKTFKGQRVVTFKDIDLVHKRPEGTADRNFRENKEKFPIALKKQIDNLNN